MSLVFTETARPADADMLVLLPDALIPTDLAPSWAPYPLAVEPHARRALYVEGLIPDSAKAGPLRVELRVKADGVPLADQGVDLDVVDATLPFRAARAFAFFDRGTLEETFENPADVEHRLVQLLRAHHLETLRQITTPAEVDDFSGALSGAWLTPAAGYRGPGVGVPHSLLAIGAYGTLGPPDANKLSDLGAIAARVPPSVRDLFLYAVDEECKSPWPAEWKRLLAESAAKELAVGATCGADPLAHGADVVIQLPEDLDPSRVAPARERAKAVWSYNGRRPYSGAPVVDVPSTDLVANGWIAARYGIPRWFYWEATSWTSYGGGKVGGDTDPVVVAESFKNRDGDHSNGDGIPSTRRPKSCRGCARWARTPCTPRCASRPFAEASKTWGTCGSRAPRSRAKPTPSSRVWCLAPSVSPPARPGPPGPTSLAPSTTRGVS